MDEIRIDRIKEFEIGGNKIIFCISEDIPDCEIWLLDDKKLEIRGRR